MTISDASSRSSFPGDGTADVRTTDFSVFNVTEMEVWLVEDDGTESLLTAGVDYTAVARTPLPGLVDITPDAAIAVDDTWIALRKTPDTQGISYGSTDDFPSASHEQGLDRAAMRALERSGDIVRCMRLSALDEPEDMELPRKALRLGMLSAYDDTDGKPTCVDPSVLVADGFTVTAKAKELLDDLTEAAMRTTLAVPENNADVDRIGAGTIANIWSASAAKGWYYATDTQRLYYSNGTAWKMVTLGQFARASWPSPSVAGRVNLDTTFFQAFYDNGSADKPIRNLPPDYREGCNVTYASATTFTAPIGAFRDSADEINLILATALTKTVNTSGDWGAGANGNAFGLTSPAPASAWRRVFLIGKDDGSIDVGCDASDSAANLRSDSGYDYYKRIGWIYLDGSKQLISSYVTGDWTWWSVPQTAHTDAGDQDYTAGSQISYAMVPPSVVARGLVAHENLSGVAILLAGDQSCGVPSATATPIGAFVTGGQPVYYDLPINSSNQVYVRTSAGETTIKIHIDVHGWFDDRLAA